MKPYNVFMAVLGTLLASVLLIAISPILFLIAVCFFAIPKILICVLKLGGCLAAGTDICCKTAFKLTGFALKTFGCLLLLPTLIIGTATLIILI